MPATPAARPAVDRLTALALVLCALSSLALLRGYAGRMPPTEVARWRGLAAPGTASAGVRGPRRGRLAWSFATRGRITGRPALAADGAVYVTSHDGHLYALDPVGRLRWRRALGGVAYGGAAVDAAGNVYAGSDAGRLWSFDRAGSLRFAQPVGAPVETAPMLDATRGRVLIAAGRALLALDAAQGHRAWRFDAWGKIFTRAVVGTRGIYVGAQDHRVHALTHAGRERWFFETGADVDAAPALSDEGELYVGSDDGALYALDAAGRLRWRRALGSRLRAEVALVGEPVSALVVVEHGLRPALLALDAADGHLRGRLALGLSDSAERSGRAAPLVDADGVVYLGLPDHRVVAIGRAARPLWSYTTAGAVQADPVLGPDGTLYIGSDDGVLYAFRD